MCPTIPRGLYASSRYLISSSVSLMWMAAVRLRRDQHETITPPRNGLTKNIFKVLQVCRADNGRRDTLFGEDPRSGDLRHANATLRSHLFHPDHSIVRISALWKRELGDEPFDNILRATLLVLPNEPRVLSVRRLGESRWKRTNLCLHASSVSRAGG